MRIATLCAAVLSCALVAAEKPVDRTPKILEQPTDFIVKAGKTADFMCKVRYYGKASVSTWQEYLPEIKDWVPVISRPAKTILSWDVQHARLKFEHCTKNDNNRKFRYTLTSAHGTVTSKEVTLTVEED